MSDAGAPPVQARGLVKQYDDVTAVAGVDLTVERGDVYGYLGPNGAGKTTVLRMLLGLIRPTSGEARLFGRDPLVEGARALDGVAGFVEAPRFYPYLSGRKNLEMLAALDGHGAAGRIDAALDIVEMADRQKHRVGGYSHGMRQRLGVAAALLRDPKLLLLDEPATGLDPAGMRDMRALVARLSSEGTTVLLSSHLMPEVEELCNRVAIVRTGRIVYEGDITSLRARAGSHWRLRTTEDERARRVVEAQRGITAVAHDPDTPSAPGALRFEGEEAAVGELSIALVEAGLGLLELTPVRATLEDVFFTLTEDGAAVPPSSPADSDAVAA
ncbi:ABC transporter ATP-binding protein [Paraconexibacter antarcticus]|uniref:ABC transporter ATP-binding protein n=1 Tax=Paraconexibacter antarcticus TaxID=2949664 RepID=A0ABY5DZL4_9ACTN|nr:ABC transporter ATP-binding protein [Paraconexibacter antarcticus]UTI66277.1 ABC transporter ATP-binding protein [Paraconexibacter antarcticus]